MTRPLTQAEKWRAHREAFTLALELGITPKEAEREIARIKAREAHRAATDRLAAKMAAPLPKPNFDADESRDPQPWMMRD